MENLNCYSCKNTECCPEHCCDWDSCRCKDCENCGGVASEARKVFTTSKPSEQKPQLLSQTVSNQKSQLNEIPGPESAMSIIEYINKKAQESLKQQRAYEAKRAAENEEERRIYRERHNAILLATRKTIEKNKEVLENTENTLGRMKATMNDIKQTEKKFQDFHDSFDRAMKAALSNCFDGIEDPEEMKSAHGVPQRSSIQEVSEILLSCRNIAIITGAGVSAESGVFTYKGNEETYQIGGSPMKLQEIMNCDIFNRYPLEFWQNIQFNRSRFAACRANLVHDSLNTLINLYKGKGRKVSLITQNIDGFDKEKLRNSPDFYEIHGNTHEMRCKDLCCGTVVPCPDFKVELIAIPSCLKCGGIMRPNVLLYGESYSEEFYRAITAGNACKEADALVIIGTQIKCGFPLGQVNGFAKTGKPIIEINLEPVIQYGKVYVLGSKCGDVLPKIVESIRKSLSRTH